MKINKIKLNSFIKSFPDITKSGVSFSQISSIGIGGEIGAICDVKNTKELTDVLAWLKNAKLHYIILGNGTNIVGRDSGFSGVVIRLVGEFRQVSKKGEKVVAGAGVNMFVLGKKLQEFSLAGLEFAYGIPGSVGGCVFMNAGAFGGCVGDKVLWVEVLENNKIKKYFNKKCNFSYRKSIFSQKKEEIYDNFPIILRVCFKLEEQNRELILKKQNEYFEKRKQTQPHDFRSAGSVFRRAGEFIPAKAIDDLGLKGKTMGGAAVSKKHAGFIVNLGSATCQDFLNLVSYIQELVYNNYKQKLELEIQVLGD